MFYTILVVFDMIQILLDFLYNVEQNLDHVELQNVGDLWGHELVVWIVHNYMLDYDLLHLELIYKENLYYDYR